MKTKKGVKGTKKFNPSLFAKTKKRVFGLNKIISKKKKRLAKKMNAKDEDAGKC
ncbi:hypothetical protein MUP35_04360 [Patescibacteria group bacterium]|nr:hypothetical protein [Patescibacteria group bacterium]